MIPRFRGWMQRLGAPTNRRPAQALQEALERYDALLASGQDSREARAGVALSLPDDLKTAFALAVALPDASAPTPEPSFADAFEARLRTATIVRKSVARPRPRITFAPLGLAAAVLIIAALFVPALNSLPGDALYGMKRASENAQVFITSGQAEADLRIAFAKKRFAEVEDLVARSKLQALRLRPGTYAAAISTAGFSPKLAALIQSTLKDAEAQITKAASILIDQNRTSRGLAKLVAVSQFGQKLAEHVADDLPHGEKRPVLQTVVTLAKIEAQANAARMTVVAAPPSPPVCTTPSPSPTPSETPSASEPAPTEATPTASPTATPTGTPCVSPSPVASVTPSPTPTATPEASPVPTATPTDEGAGEGGSGNSEEVNGQNAQPEPSGDASANAMREPAST